MATVVADYALGQTGVFRYESLLKDLFREVATLDASAVRRAGARKPLIEECKELSKRRNMVLHRGESVTVHGDSP